FVAIGIMIAWVCTITFVPAYVMMIEESSLANFGSASGGQKKKTLLSGVLRLGGRFTYIAAKPILIVIVLVAVVAVYGITRIEINDNPVKWFSMSHPIRRADIELNKHFGGTYMAYLVLESGAESVVTHDYVGVLRGLLLKKAMELKEELGSVGDEFAEMDKMLLANASKEITRAEYIGKLAEFAGEKEASADANDAYVWYELVDFFELEAERIKIFKQPEVLRYLSRLQEYLRGTVLVGKSNSVADIVKKVHKELMDGKEESYIIPDSSAAVAQCLIQFESSHNNDDLWHFITYDYMSANVWLQLTSGDNKDMEKVVGAVTKFVKDNPPPTSIKHNWAGLTYINTVWQDKMVWGMLQSFMGSFIIVFIMMAVLFRSALWGIVCMIPLLVTITVIYGIIGLVGKDYDMPVAVLSALTLGMAVDFAIHFLERARTSVEKTGSWKESSVEMFGEPARAISRNVLVIAIGFLPLLAAPLVPYKTVGIFLCSIMAFSGIVTLLVLPAIIRVAEKRLFRAEVQPVGPSCNCIFCVVISAASVLLIALNMHQFAIVGWSTLVWVSALAIPVLALLCGVLSRRRACKAAISEKQQA
ncbi:MAG: MMPL family transporter, partial [Phycisphaerae bacterium]|nr:MMPL family transporter [Phycisphaerae bacterium]